MQSSGVVITSATSEKETRKTAQSIWWNTELPIVLTSRHFLDLSTLLIELIRSDFYNVVEIFNENALDIFNTIP